MTTSHRSRVWGLRSAGHRHDQVLATARRRPPLHRLARYGVQPLLLGVDLLAAAGAGALGGAAPVALLALGASTGLLLALGGLYRSHLTLSVLDDLPDLLGRPVAAGAITAAVLSALGQPVGRDVLETVLALAVSITALRAAAYQAVRGLRAAGAVQHTTLILGAGRVGGQLAGLLVEHPEFGLRPVGFLDPEPLVEPEDLPVPLLGGLDQLSTVIVDLQVRCVIAAFTATRESELVDLIRTCDRLRCEIFFVPRLFELHHTSRDMDQVWGLPLIRLRRATFRTPAWRLKRVLDVCVSLVLLALLAPVMLACAAAVRLSDGRGVLFRQERVGLDGRPISLLKFRSMSPASPTEAASAWNIADDPRISRVGHVLRATSLDELPQLLNVLRGEMSLVGPRPERPHFVSEFTAQFPRYPARHRVPCGLTGWAQVHGLRGDTSIADRARFDNYYVENWSLWLDVKILLRTVLAVVRREGS